MLCPLSALQTRLYRLLVDRARGRDKKRLSGAVGKAFSVNNLLMQLRKVGSHTRVEDGLDQHSAEQERRVSGWAQRDRSASTPTCTCTTWWSGTSWSRSSSLPRGSSSASTGSSGACRSVRQTGPPCQ